MDHTCQHSLILLIFVAALCLQLHASSATCQVENVYTDSACSAANVWSTSNKVTTSCTASSTCSGASASADAYSVVECNTADCSPPPADVLTVPASIFHASYLTLDCSGATEKTPFELDKCATFAEGTSSVSYAAFAKDGWIYYVVYDGSTYCTSKTGTMKAWNKVKPGCYKKANSSGSVKWSITSSGTSGTATSSSSSTGSNGGTGSGTCSNTTTYTTSTCDASSVMSVKYAPNPQYCYAVTCQATTGGAYGVACANSSCVEPPTGTPASGSVSYYAADDCSGSAVKTDTKSQCSADTEEGTSTALYASDGWLWMVDYDSVNFCTSKTGNRQSWSKWKPGCYKNPAGTGSMKYFIGGAAHVGATMAGVAMLIVGVLFAL